MKSIFKATAILSGGSAVTILVGLVSAKVMASVLQPAGNGYYGLLQSFVSVTILIAGLGISTGLVRSGASAVTQGDLARISSLRRAAWVLFCGSGALVLLLLALFGRTMSRWAWGTPDHAVIILLMGIAPLFGVAGQIQY